MREKRQFPSLLDLFKHLCEEHDGAFSAMDICIAYYGNDDRIGWETYIVRTRKYFGEQGAVLGFLTFE